MTATSHQIWRERGDALFATIDHQLTTMHTGRDVVSRQSTLAALLSALKSFGQSQLTFFTDGFGDEAKVRLEPSTIYPPEYALRTTVDQIAYDLDVIQRAYQQRLPAQSTPAMREALAKADYLAYKALQPAIEGELVNDVTVVTYFQKAINVRIIPYAPVALLNWSTVDSHNHTA